MRYGRSPVPVHFCTDLLPYTGIVADNHYVDDDEFTWTFWEIVLAILALRAVSRL
jgi:hypothetical protein